MTVKEHYTLLGNLGLDILNKTINDSDSSLLSINHAFLNDFSLWLDVLNERPEIGILNNSIKEYQFGILSSCFGLYQQAFMGLRFFLERTLVAILFSANEVELNLWKLGERDTYWAEIMDKDKGVFSHKFCRAFFPGLKDELGHFSAITQKVYRECSEYVHGNLAVIDKIPKDLSYSANLFNEWNVKADIIRRVVLFTFCLRYLRYLKPDNVKKIEVTIAEEFKSISQIADLIN